MALSQSGSSAVPKLIARREASCSAKLWESIWGLDRGRSWNQQRR
jgi:hypothetical protein